MLLRKPRVTAEVYNDLDGEVVNVFRVLRNPQMAARLRALVELTPFARAEFELSYEPSDDPVEQARRTVARTFMAFGTSSRRPGYTGFRAKGHRRDGTTAQDWRSWPDHIPDFVNRLREVIIDCRPALEVIRQQDGPDTLIFADPPYVMETRTSYRGGRRSYAHEMSDDDHRALALELQSIRGMAIVCGYASELYDSELYRDWHRVELAAMADAGQDRTEVLWFNAAAVAAKRPLLAQAYPVSVSSASP